MDLARTRPHIFAAHGRRPDDAHLDPVLVRHVVRQYVFGRIRRSRFSRTSCCGFVVTNEDMTKEYEHGSRISDANKVYALGAAPTETDRLRRQAEELLPDSAALLERVGLSPGQSAIDLGCGPQGVLELLAQRVAPGGRVVGVDSNATHTAMATQYCTDRNLSGVELVTADARRTGLPAGLFDVVHARTLLINVPDPASVVAEMVRLARPGGWVALMEPDTEYWMSYPQHPAVARLGEIFPIVFERNGADSRIGRRLTELLRDAALEEVGVEVRPQTYPPGHTRRTILPDLIRAMRQQVLDIGLASNADLDELDAAARAHLEDPRTVAVSGFLFLSWARKPA
jgi:SAM-dependent methyltransferase